jgi:hypothetical protein
MNVYDVTTIENSIVYTTHIKADNYHVDGTMVHFWRDKNDPTNPEKVASFVTTGLVSIVLNEVCP